jgi:hypothetical protein
MAYVAGDNITASDFNSLFLEGTTSGNYGINHIMGTGTGNLGLGQTADYLPSLGDTRKVGEQITTAEWNSLFSVMNNLANHTNDTLSYTENRTAGEKIAVLSGLNADLQTLAASVQLGCPNATALLEGSVDEGNSSSAVWDGAHIAEYSYTFAGGDEARWFFNAGGKCSVTFSNTATNTTGLDAVVSGLMSNITRFDLGATTSTVTGNLNADSTEGDSAFNEDSTTPWTGSIGYYDLTTSYQTLLYYEESSGTYDYSYEGLVSIRIEAKTSTAHADGRGNNGEVVTLRVTIRQADTNYTSGVAKTGIAKEATRDYDGVSAKIEENSCGPTTINFLNTDPTTAQGLGVVYTTITVAKVSASRLDDGTTTSL